MRDCWINGFLFCILAALLSAGCNRGPDLPKAVPVSGTVTLDGKPLAGVTVRFTPIENTPGTGAAGSTDKDGKYSISDRRGDKGAAVGAYRVTIYMSDMGPPQPSSGPRLSEKYRSADQSILRATVPEGGAKVDFPLKSNP
jgi:hypothetical protein